MGIHRLTEDDIKAMATELVGNTLVVASAIPEDLISMVFIPIALGGLPGDIDPADVGNIVGSLKGSTGQAVNGYPVLMSCQVVHRDDWDQVHKLYEQARAALA
jgi:hypothetical protein